jgi:hypothetical protein
MKRPTTKAKVTAFTDARVLEALEREEAMGYANPPHLKAMKADLKKKPEKVEAKKVKA